MHQTSWQESANKCNWQTAIRLLDGQIDMWPQEPMGYGLSPGRNANLCWQPSGYVMYSRPITTESNVATSLPGLTQAWREEAATAYCGGCSRSWQPYWREGVPAAAAEGAAGLCQRSPETMVRLLSALPAAEASANMLQLVVGAY